MRSSSVLFPVLALALLSTPAARACDPVVTACLPPLMLFPAYTPEGVRVGTVVARTRPALPLETSRFTGQPLTVAFNNPDGLPGSVDPTFALLPLPRSPRFHTQAVYPRGY